LTESIRTQGSRLRAALSCLPLTAREIALMTWLPTFAVSLLVLGLLLIPGAAVFSGLGFPWHASVVDALLSLLCGYCLAALVVGLVRIVLGKSSWSGVQYPVMLLTWIGLMALETWQTSAAFQAATLQPLAYVLVEPWLVHATIIETIPVALLAAIELGTVVSIGLLIWSAARAAEAQYPVVAWRWTHRRRPALVTLELTRLLRSRDVMTNAIGAGLVNLGLAFALSRTPVTLRSQLATLLLPAMMMVAAIPLVLVRGLTRSRWPIPLILGYSPATWTSTQLVAGVSVALSMIIPGVVALIVFGVPITTMVGSGIPYAVLSIGFAIATGWIAPASPENPVGQIVDAFLLVFVLTGVEVAAFYILTAGTPTWFAVLVVLGALSTSSAFAIEKRRWLRRSGDAAHNV